MNSVKVTNAAMIDVWLVCGRRLDDDAAFENHLVVLNGGASVEAMRCRTESKPVGFL